MFYLFIFKPLESIDARPKTDVRMQRTSSLNFTPALAFTCFCLPVQMRLSTAAGCLCGPSSCVTVCSNGELWWGPCFLGNESRSAVTGTHCRFEEVGKVYGEESAWHGMTCSIFCVCVCGEKEMCAVTQQGLEPRFHQSGRFGCWGPDNGECQAMWIKDVGL